MPAPDPLALLLKHRGTLEVLEYLAANPQPKPDRARAALKINSRTYYEMVARLERMDMVAWERFPGSRKRRSVSMTSRGQAALGLVEGLRASVVGSRASLEQRLSLDAPAAGSADAGELLLRLIEYAERAADYGDMRALSGRAVALKRPGEAAFAIGLMHFLRGERVACREELNRAVELLAGEPSSRSYRRALYYHAANLDDIGEPKRAHLELMRVRRLAHLAHDDVTESDARLGIGRLKAVIGQWKDSRAHLEKALECAKRTGSPGRQSKVLTSLCLADFMVDHGDGIPRSDQALEMARRAGSKIMTMHIRGNRALMFAYRGDKEAAYREMAAARRIAKEAGYEPGLEVLVAWGTLTKRIARYPRGAYPEDLRGQVSALLSPPPSSPPSRSRGP